MADAPPHSLVLRFAQIIAGLREAVAECGGRRLLAGPLTVRLWSRLGRMERLFAALLAHLARFGADAPRRTYRKRRARAPLPQDPAPVPAAGPATPLVRPLRLSNRRAWLVSLNLGTAAAGSRLRFLLNDPEMAALLVASPRLVALPRPLCRMPAVDLPAAVLPPRPAKAERPRRPRRRRWRPSRRADLTFLLRMGTPLIET